MKCRVFVKDCGFFMNLYWKYRIKIQMRKVKDEKQFENILHTLLLKKGFTVTDKNSTKIFTKKNNIDFKKDLQHTVGVLYAAQANLKEGSTGGAAVGIYSAIKQLECHIAERFQS